MYISPTKKKKQWGFSSIIQLGHQNERTIISLSDVLIRHMANYDSFHCIQCKRQKPWSGQRTLCDLITFPFILDLTSYHCLLPSFLPASVASQGLMHTRQSHTLGSLLCLLFASTWYCNLLIIFPRLTYPALLILYFLMQYNLITIYIFFAYFPLSWNLHEG
jgi:hypothetical protein